jgi:membrane protease subunit (stomatin/prohibitin family)
MARTAAVAGTASAVSGRVARHQRDKFADQDAQYYQQVTEPGQQPAAAAPAAPDYMAELEKLAQLRDQGVITADDFEAKKKQLLGI